MVVGGNGKAVQAEDNNLMSIEFMVSRAVYTLKSNDIKAM